MPDKDQERRLSRFEAEARRKEEAAAREQAWRGSDWDYTLDEQMYALWLCYEYVHRRNFAEFNKEDAEGFPPEDPDGSLPKDPGDGDGKSQGEVFLDLTLPPLERHRPGLSEEYAEIEFIRFIWNTTRREWREIFESRLTDEGPDGMVYEFNPNGPPWWYLRDPAQEASLEA